MRPSQELELPAAPDVAAQFAGIGQSGVMSYLGREMRVCVKFGSNNYGNDDNAPGYR